MSWMDSWSRPNKQSAIPPPLYLTTEDTKYCSTCGRVIGARRSHQKNKVVKYCSDGCRKHRVGPLDKKIDQTILALLLGEENSGLETTDVKARFKKGDKRHVITCNEIENIVFKRDAAAQQDDGDEHDNVDVVDDAGSEDDSPADETRGGGAPVIVTQDANEEPHNDSHAKPPDASDLDNRRQEGQRRADEKEKVRRAARRAVVFGFPIAEPDDIQTKARGKATVEQEQLSEEAPRRKCEALVNGRVVEPSFAKGNWSIRWRD